MISNDLRADVIAELRFIETNLRQMAQVLDELERPSKSTLESMSGACEGWAERITRLPGALRTTGAAGSNSIPETRPLEHPNLFQILELPTDHALTDAL